MVYYHVPPGWGNGSAVVAQGEPVREGQLLLRVCDLSRFLAILQVPVAKLGTVKIHQPAIVHVHAYPSKSWSGRVVAMGAPQSNGEFTASHVQIAFVGETDGLKPVMSSEAVIETGRQTGVVHVPVTALVGGGLSYYCYIRAGQELQKRKVVPGLRNEDIVQITDGLTEGEIVLHDPRGLLRWSSRTLQAP